MKTAFYLLALAFVIAISGAVDSNAAVRHNRTGPGSFVPYRADSVQMLVDELAANKTVASRYARHFGMTPEAVIQYFRDNLKLTYLDKPEKTTAYFVSKGGRILSRACVLPKGTPVFATSDGGAILEWRCGNPLTTRLPSARTSSNPTTKGAPEVKVAAFAQETGALPPALTPEAVEVASLPPTVAPTLLPTLETTANPPVAFAPVLAAIAPLLAGIVSVQHSEPASHVVVPEPSAFVALAMGLSGALILRRAKSRTR